MKKHYVDTYIIRFTLFSFAVITVFIVFLFVARAFGLSFFYKANTVDLQLSSMPVTVIIDPGHGGVDTGASGTYGKNESYLCLEIAEKIKDALALSDYNVIMTRTDDKMLVSSKANISRKQSDLLGRVEFTNKFSNPIFVSIHMNTFPDESCKGSQIFYSKNNEKSADLASCVKDSICFVDSDNKRLNKEAGSNIFVLDHLDCPAILVECGFLTNHSEEKLLNDAEYQNKLATVIASGIINYLSKGD